MASAGTQIGGGSGAGTNVGPGAQGSVFNELLLNASLVADAFVDPTDTPVQDTLRLQKDADGDLALYVFNVTNGQWRAVELA